MTIESEPETIVSIQTSNTEILYALGVGDRMIGVSDYCNYPDEALEIQKVGATRYGCRADSFALARYRFCHDLPLQFARRHPEAI